jgi:Tfp pilus assembly protein PilO
MVDLARGGEATSDQVAQPAALVELLQQERDVRDNVVERLRQRVSGVQVAQRVEDVHQLGVEAQLLLGRSRAVESVRQEPKPLQQPRSNMSVSALTCQCSLLADVAENRLIPAIMIED